MAVRRMCELRHTSTVVQKMQRGQMRYAALPIRRQTTITSIIGRDVQATFHRRRHQPRRPPPAKIRPGSPAPAMGPGTGTDGGSVGVSNIAPPASPSALLVFPTTMISSVSDHGELGAVNVNFCSCWDALVQVTPPRSLPLPIGPLSQTGWLPEQRNTNSSTVEPFGTELTWKILSRLIWPLMPMLCQVP